MPIMDGDKHPKKISIKDLRKIDAATGRPITGTNNRNTDLNIELASRIIKRAKENGIDPMTALAIAYQETNFAMPTQRGGYSAYAKIDPYKLVNPFQVGGKAQFNDGTYPGEWMAKNNGTSLDVFFPLYKEKLELAKRLGKKDEASIIQSWNGYGKLPKGYYGIDEEIDMNKNPIYGKSVIDLRDNVLRRNPDLIKLVDSLNTSPQKSAYLNIMKKPSGTK